MLLRQHQQISVGYLPRAMYTRAVHDPGIDDGDVVGPEQVSGMVQPAAQAFE